MCCFKRGEGTADWDTVAPNCSTGNCLSTFKERISLKISNWEIWARWGLPTASSPLILLFGHRRVSFGAAVAEEGQALLLKRAGTAFYICIYMYIYMYIYIYTHVYTIPCRTVPYHTKPYHATPRAAPWCDLTCRDMLWFGMIVIIVMIIVMIIVIMIVSMIVIMDRKGGWYGWKPSSSSNFSIRVVRADPLIEIRQTVPCRSIRGNSISVNSTLPPSQWYDMIRYTWLGPHRDTPHPQKSDLITLTHLDCSE